jgi:hypothetical protein
MSSLAILKATAATFLLSSESEVELEALKTTSKILSSALGLLNNIAEDPQVTLI